jgi:hypothetical protein
MGTVCTVFKQHTYVQTFSHFTVNRNFTFECPSLSYVNCLYIYRKYFATFLINKDHAANQSVSVN